MNDHARPIDFGFFLIPEAKDPSRLLLEARRAEAAGLDQIERFSTEVAPEVRSIVAQERSGSLQRADR